MPGFDIPLPGGKRKFTRKEVLQLLDAAYKIHLEKMKGNKALIQELEQQNQYWSAEHNKSLVLIVENASQKLELEELNVKLKKAFEQLEKESKTDYLTKLLNRGALIESLQSEIKRISRTKESILRKVKEWQEKKIEDIDGEHMFTSDENLGKLVCAILDIDHFKQVNDTYGHLTGDRVLKEVGSVLVNPEILRSTDISGRFGGEEFLIIFPQTSGVHALVPLQKIAEAIRETEFLAGDKTPFRITVSIGISEYRETDNSINDMIKRADDALYAAKEKGRDRILLYDQL